MLKRVMAMIVMVAVLSSCGMGTLKSTATTGEAKREFIRRLRQFDEPNASGLIGRTDELRVSGEEGIRAFTTIIYDTTSDYGFFEADYLGQGYVYDSDKMLTRTSDNEEWYEISFEYPIPYLSEQIISERLVAYLNSLENSKFYFEGSDPHFKLETISELYAIGSPGDDREIWDKVEDPGNKTKTIKDYYEEQWGEGRDYYHKVYFEGNTLVYESVDGNLSKLGLFSPEKLPVPKEVLIDFEVDGYN